MGILDIFKRKKESDGLELSGEEQDIPFDQNPQETPTQDFSNPNELGPRPRFQQENYTKPQDINPFGTTTQGMNNSDIQLMMTKLELINQRLEVIDRRIQIIEQIAKESR